MSARQTPDKGSPAKPARIRSLHQGQPKETSKLSPLEVIGFPSSSSIHVPGLDSGCRLTHVT